MIYTKKDDSLQEIGPETAIKPPEKNKNVEKSVKKEFKVREIATLDETGRVGPNFEVKRTYGE